MRIVMSFAIALAVLSCTGAGSAATSADWPAGPERRVLGGHQFQPLAAMRDPFVTTHLQTLTGAGLATGFEAPFLSADGDTIGTLDGDIAFFSLAFEYQLNLAERYSLLVGMSAAGRSGIDDQALLADGLSTVYGLTMEGKATLWTDGRTQLAAVARISRKNVFGIDPFGFAQKVIEAGGLTKENQLVVEGDINRGALGLAVAHGWRPWLGLTGFALAGSAQPVFDDAGRESFGQAGAEASLDLDPLHGIPVGFALGYTYDSFPEGGGDVAKGIHRGIFAVCYTGRPDFHFGFELSVATLKQTDVENTFASTTGVLDLRYYF